MPAPSKQQVSKRYYPIYLDLADKICVVIGGGKVAQRKVNTLLEYGARVILISPQISEKLSELVASDKLTWYNRPYRDGDLEKSFLAYSATDDNSTNCQVFEEARRRNILINVVDVPDLCNFIVPSIVSRGDLSISISTGGKSPALSKRIRKELEKSFGQEYAVYLNIMGEIRKMVIYSGLEIADRKLIFKELAACLSLMELIAGKRRRELWSTINGILSKYKLKLPDDCDNWLTFSLGTLDYE